MASKYAKRLEVILDKFDADCKAAKKRKDEAVNKLMKDLLTMVDYQKLEVDDD